jgi:hypothetical protein
LPAAGAALAIALAVGSVASVLLMPEGPLRGSSLLDAVVFLGLFVPLVVALAAMGLLVLWRSPGHPVGALMIGAGIGIGLAFGGGTYAGLSTMRGGPALPGAVIADWVGSWASTLGLALLGLFVPLVFPTGRFLSPRWRRLGLALAGVVVVGTVATALLPGPLGNDPAFDNPFGIVAAGPLLNLVVTLFNLCAPLAFGSGLLCLVLRYRRGTLRERAQIKLFAYPVVVAVLALIVSVSNPGGPGDTAWEAALLAMTGIPVAIAIAIVRHGLFDIDRLISRTLAYATLTALLLALYAVVVLAAQPLFAALTGGTDLAVAAATLAAAAVFQPHRRRIQGVVDRRVDRAR